MANRNVLMNAPSSVEDLRQAVQAHFAALSPRLQQVAELFLRDPQALAIESSRDLAQVLDLPASTLTRFAKVMGYATFKEIQALCKQQYVNLPRDYLERIKHAQTTDKPLPPQPAMDLAHAVQQSLQLTAIEISATSCKMRQPCCVVPARCGSTVYAAPTRWRLICITCCSSWACGPACWIRKAGCWSRRSVACMQAVCYL